MAKSSEWKYSVAAAHNNYYAFHMDLKGLIENEFWANVNWTKAGWVFMEKDRYKKYNASAAEDKERAEKHWQGLQQCVPMVCTARTLEHVKKLAGEAGKEAGTAVMNNDKLVFRFLERLEFKDSGAYVIDELGRPAWDNILTALQHLSAHAKTRKRDSPEKRLFDKACDDFADIPRRAKQQRDRGNLEEARRRNQPRQQKIQSHEFDKLEERLYRETGGRFTPERTAQGVGKGRVSVVTPTVESRQDFHRILWHCFEAQDWPDKELIVVETYRDKPSEFLFEIMKKDSRLIYREFKMQDGADWAIGLKRNIGANLATGEFIANFDDDDVYAPTYLTTMVELLERSATIGAKLRSWHIYYSSSDTVGEANPVIEASLRCSDYDLDQGDSDKWIYGYGFSYVLRRQAVLDNPYKSINWNEDFEFISELRARHGRDCIALLEDKTGICMHTQHAANTARDYALWELSKEAVLDLEFANFYPVFGLHREVCRLSRAANNRDDDSASKNEQDAFLMQGKPRHRPRRYHEIAIHADSRQYQVRCPVGATGEDLVSCMREQSCGHLATQEIFRVPSVMDVGQSERDQWLHKVLKVLSPIAPSAWQLAHPNDQHEYQRELLPKLFERATNAIRPNERVGLTTTDLWVRPVEPGSPSDQTAASTPVEPGSFHRPETRGLDVQRSNATSAAPAVAAPSTSSPGSPASPFFGRWMDQEGVEITIDASEVRGPNTVLEFQLLEADLCQMTAGSKTFEGRLVDEGSGVQLRWSDGDFWVPATTAAITAGSHIQ